MKLKMLKKLKKATMAIAILYLISASVAASQMKIKVCSILLDIQYVLTNIGGTLVLIMFIYGGLRYVFGADDPGARKQGKMTAIHSVIGGILIYIADTVINTIGLTGC